MLNGMNCVIEFKHLWTINDPAPTVLGRFVELRGSIDS